jgi:tryptophan 2,3-dioxygenase
LDLFKSDKDGKEKIEKRMKEKSIKTLIYDWLTEFSALIPDDFIEHFLKEKQENLIFQKSIWLDDKEKIQEYVKIEMESIKPYLEGKTMKEETEEETERIKKRRLSLLFLMSYREEIEYSKYSEILELLIALEESFVLWRTRHVRMVERMIGRRMGTGASSGVDYLEKTTQGRILTDLWEVRTHFIRSTSLKKFKLKKF